MAACYTIFLYHEYGLTNGHCTAGLVSAGNDVERPRQVNKKLLLRDGGLTGIRDGVCVFLGIGWLVGWFGFNVPLRQYFSLCRAVSQREEERGEKR